MDGWGARRQGTAILMVLGFISVVFILAFSVSTMSSGMRRMEAGTVRKSQALTLALSALDEASAALALEHVFPPGMYASPQRFFLWIRDDDRSELDSVCGPCSEWRPIRDSEGVERGRIWAAWTFPSHQLEVFEVPHTEALAFEHAGEFRVSEVRMRPLRFRRDHLGGAWLNWGVVQLEVTVTIGGSILGGTEQRVRVDRMFTVDIDLEKVEVDPETGRTRTDFPVALLVADRDLRRVVSRT